MRAVRHNTGKPNYALTPLRLIAKQYQDRQGLSNAQRLAANVLMLLGNWQARSGSGTAMLSLALSTIGPDAWSRAAAGFERGLEKYDSWNWAKGLPWSNPLASAARHIIDGVLTGEELDPESGLPHINHVACNIIMLLTYTQTYPDGDDRPPAGLL